MVRQAHHRSSFKRYLILISLLPALFSCGSAGSQFSTKLIANPFVSELYGNAIKTLVLTAEPGSHIAWMGLDWSGDYKFFKVDTVTVNGETKSPDAAGSTALYTNITMPPTPDLSGSASAPSQMLVKIIYAPLVAISAEVKPHKAYLLIAYDKPEEGIVRVELTGYTRGIAEASCGANDEQQIYHLKDGTFQLYLCDSDGIPADQLNGKSPAGTADVNLASIPISDNFVFYKASETNACVLGGSASVEPTFPDFQIPVPPGIPGVPLNFKLPVTTDEGKNFDCVLSGGAITCDNDVELSVMSGAIGVSPLTVTNGTTLPTSRDCPNFGEIVGGGSFGGNELKIVAWGVVQPGSLTTGFKIDGALVVAVMELVK